MSSQKVSPATFGPVIVRPLSPALGGEVVGLDISRPREMLNPGVSVAKSVAFCHGAPTVGMLFSA